MTPPPAEQLAARIFMGPALRAQPDRRLVYLVRDGYDAAFEEIVRRYRRQLDRFAAAIVGGHSEDVTQDAFSKALQALRGSEAEIELRPWLYRIVRNTALNDLRDRAPATDELPEEGLPGGPSAVAAVLAREELADLLQRLRALPEPQRAALVMRELEGLSHEEIAAALGVTGGAARQVIFRARAALRDGLGLLIPVPLVRALAEHGGEAGRAGGAIAAGASASSAGGAALGGLGGGALKAGMATVLIAGAVGAGVAVEHHQGARPRPAAADAAPLAQHQKRSGAAPSGAASPWSRSGSHDHAGGRGTSGQSGHGGSGGSGGSLGSSSQGGSGGGSGHSGSDSGHSGGGPGGPGSPSPSSGSGGSDHQSSGGGGDTSGSGGSGSGDGSGGSLGSSDGGNSSGSSGGDGGGETTETTEPTPVTQPESSGSGDSGSESSGSSGSSGDLSGSGSGSVDGSSTGS